MRIAGPLNKETGKGEPFKLERLTDTESDAFRKLKKNLVSLPIAAYLRYGYRCIVYSEEYE